MVKSIVLWNGLWSKSSFSNRKFVGCLMVGLYEIGKEMGLFLIDKKKNNLSYYFQENTRDPAEM